MSSSAAEAISSAEANVKGAERMIGTTEDPGEEQQEALESTAARHEENTSHKEHVVALRSWWSGEPWMDETEEERQREEEEVMRFLKASVDLPPIIGNGTKPNDRIE